MTMVRFARPGGIRMKPVQKTIRISTPVQERREETMVTRRRSIEPKFDLVVFGEFFSDMIFYRLPGRPRFGEESKTDSFLVAPGGGLSTTAIAASRLGIATGIVTRVGADAGSLPTWAEIVREKLDITACEFRKDLPTALKICWIMRRCSESSRRRATCIWPAPCADLASGCLRCAGCVNEA